MIEPGFDLGFGLVLSGSHPFLVVLAAGLWAGLLGTRAAWALPGALLLGLAIGMTAIRLGYPLPYATLVAAMSCIVIGLAVALETSAPIWMAAIVVALAGLYQGALVIALDGRSLTTWLGAVSGIVFAQAGGIGLVAMATQARTRIAVRVIGALIALLGALSLFGVV